MILSPDDIDHLVGIALAEDVGDGDVTSEGVLSADARLVATLAARDRIVLAGLDVARAVFQRLAPDCRFSAHAADGDVLAAGAVIAEVEGPARALLSAERTALNILQHLSGIATLTRRYVDAIAGTGAVLLDTRKTIPGLRRFAKYATAVGGARNHRVGLFDGVLIKDNHIAVCGGVGGAVVRARAHTDLKIEVECDTLDQVREAVAAGADMILLDNMTNDILCRAVAEVAGRVALEASGGVTLESVRAIAETGVDYISVGRITQSAPAADIGLDYAGSGA